MRDFGQVVQAWRGSLAERPRPLVKAGALAQQIAASEGGAGRFVLAGVPLEAGSERNGYAVLGGTEQGQAAALASVVAQIPSPHGRLIVCDPEHALCRDEELQPYLAVDSHTSEARDLSPDARLLTCGAAMHMPAGPGAHEHLSELLAWLMATHNSPPVWVVVPAIEQLDAIDGLRHVVEFGWAHGVVFAFSVTDWVMFEERYGVPAPLLVTERAHKLVLGTDDARVAEWFGDFLGGVRASQVLGLAPGRALLRPSGAYPTLPGAYSAAEVEVPFSARDTAVTLPEAA